MGNVAEWPAAEVDIYNNIIIIYIYMRNTSSRVYTYYTIYGYNAPHEVLAPRLPCSQVQMMMTNLCLKSKEAGYLSKCGFPEIEKDMQPSALLPHAMKCIQKHTKNMMCFCKNSRMKRSTRHRQSRHGFVKKLFCKGC